MGVWYSLFVRSFADSNLDGVGDLRGIINQLGYFEKLSIEGIWLSPIFEAPSYHKYDVINYFAIDPEYGTMQDFEELVAACKQKSIKLILDLVLNHTSSAHPWFKESIKDELSIYSDWYVWKKELSNEDVQSSSWYQPKEGTRKDFYYAHFWSEMPDLNYDSAAVRKQAIDIAKFWMAKGIDGFRLDAAMHIFPTDRELENHKWWKEFRIGLSNDYPNAIFIGEVSASCNVIAPYLDKALDSAFNFELAEHIIQAIINGQHFDLIDWYLGILKLYSEENSTGLDAIFLSNHDQDRIASRLLNHSEKIKLSASILLTLPGMPFIYYGEEIGMTGMKPDEHIREPFKWSHDSKLPFETHWINSIFSTSENILALDEQEKNEDSIFSHYVNLCMLRKNNPILDRGKIVSVDCNEHSILIYNLVLDQRIALIIHNLSGNAFLLKDEKESEYNFSLLYSSSKESKINQDGIEIAAYATLIFLILN